MVERTVVERTVVEKTVVERTVVETTSGGKHLSPPFLQRVTVTHMAASPLYAMLMVSAPVTLALVLNQHYPA